jgi:hypothetical protein
MHGLLLGLSRPAPPLPFERALFASLHRRNGSHFVAWGARTARAYGRSKTAAYPCASLGGHGLPSFGTRPVHCFADHSVAEGQQGATGPVATQRSHETHVTVTAARKALAPSMRREHILVLEI